MSESELHDPSIDCRIEIASYQSKEWGIAWRYTVGSPLLTAEWLALVAVPRPAGVVQPSFPGYTCWGWESCESALHSAKGFVERCILRKSADSIDPKVKRIAHQTLLIPPAWRSLLAACGGRATKGISTPAKRRAARINGKLGGRPRKPVAD